MSQPPPPQNAPTDTQPGPQGGPSPGPAAQNSPLSQDPVQVPPSLKTDEDQMQFVMKYVPPGAEFILPDGRHMRRKK